MAGPTPRTRPPDATERLGGRVAGEGAGEVEVDAVAGAVQAARSLSFSSYAADYTRYLPRDTPPGRLVRNAFGGALLGSVWIASLGAAIGTLTFVGTPTDLVNNVLPPALGALTMLALGISTITSSCLDCYSGAMAWLVVGVRMARWQAVLVVGTIGSAIGSAIGWAAGQGDYWESFQNFLILLGNWIAPWIAVMLVHHYSAPAPSDGETPRFGAGFATWLLGIAAAIPFMSQPGVFTGPLADHHPSLGPYAAAVAFTTAGLTHLLLTRTTRTRRHLNSPTNPEEIPA
ncbi:hypothetical protein ACGFYV_24700 [Streptomyces sp. NPDC048297]|uniref:hypothetical protein n=1 Tax=Streptomyces sp. NPDC048297 TaxID=3365531 RepID=UPI003723ED92